MERLLSLFLAVGLLFPTVHADTPRQQGGRVATAAFAEDTLGISAPSAILMEKETGQVLYEKNAHERLSPASVTKVMTLLLIVEDIESGKLSLEDTVTASQRASTFGGSCVYLEEGEQMSVHEMLKCITVVSANDCAVAMAEHISGSEEIFVKRMNERAKELGLQDTHFTNCTGLFEDAEHYTSAYDIAVMSRELIRHDLIKDYSTIWIDSIRNGAFELNNTNKLVYWYPGCTGLKTGFTNSAMYCLSATAERDGVEYIAVIMHGASIEDRNSDAKKLLNYAFANYELVSLLPEEPLPALPVELGRDESVTLRVEGEGKALLPKSGGTIEYAFDLPTAVAAPVHDGEKLGTLTATRDGEIVATLPLLADGAIAHIGFAGILGRLSRGLIGL